MNDEAKAIASKPIEKPSAGSKRASLALLLSLLALVASGYNVWSSYDAQENRVISPLVMEKAAGVDMGAIDSRIKAQENTALAMHDVLKQQLDELAKKLDVQNTTPSISTTNLDALSGTTASLQQKLNDLEKQYADAQLSIKNALLEQSKDLSVLAQINQVSQKMQQGLVFINEVKDMDAVLSRNENTTHALLLLKSYDAPVVSDNWLHDGLRSLSPEFLAREKLEHAEGFFDKIGIQLQKLVVVRNKHGNNKAETPAGKALAQLDEAIAIADWSRAVDLANALSEKAPKDFPDWLEQLKIRASAEKAVADLRKGLLATLRGEKKNEPVQDAAP